MKLTCVVCGRQENTEGGLDGPGVLLGSLGSARETFLPTGWRNAAASSFGFLPTCGADCELIERGSCGVLS